MIYVDIKIPKIKKEKDFYLVFKYFYFQLALISMIFKTTNEIRIIEETKRDLKITKKTDYSKHIKNIQHTSKTKLLFTFMSLRYEILNIAGFEHKLLIILDENLEIKIDKFILNLENFALEKKSQDFLFNNFTNFFSLNYFFDILIKNEKHFTFSAPMRCVFKLIKERKENASYYDLLYSLIREMVSPDLENFKSFKKHTKLTSVRNF